MFFKMFQKILKKLQRRWYHKGSRDSFCCFFSGLLKIALRCWDDLNDLKDGQWTSVCEGSTPPYTLCHVTLTTHRRAPCPKVSCLQCEHLRFPVHVTGFRQT